MLLAMLVLVRGRKMLKGDVAEVEFSLGLQLALARTATFSRQNNPLSQVQRIVLYNIRL